MSSKTKKVQAKFIMSDIEVSKAAATKVSGQITDPFDDLYEENGLLRPEYDLTTLSALPANNNVLQQCIDAYKTNMVGFGYGIRYKIDMESPDIDESIKEKARMEAQTLKIFYDYCNFDETFSEIMKKVIDARERIGFGTIEVIPKANGKPGGFEYIPAHTLRKSKVIPTPVELSARVPMPDGKIITVRYSKKFRKYCQVLESTNTRVWFKEFGDPRPMDKNTGYVVDPNSGPDMDGYTDHVDPENEANSVIVFEIHTDHSPYPLPRYIGNILSLYGSRRSEELNYNYFIKGKHIPMAILVKNGSLTESSMEQLETYANKVVGVENAYGYLILEASGFEDDETFDEANPQGVDIKIQPLVECLQQDSLFQEYDKNNRDKIRSAFRLPRIYTGDSQDYNRATADTAKEIAEEQVFAPERLEIAARLNNLINTALDIKYVELYFREPNISNKHIIAKTLAPLARAGGITPNMLIELISELLERKFEPFKEEWANKPLQVYIEELKQGANNVVDNQTEDNSQTEGGEVDE